MKRKIKVTTLINDLSIGGAEVVATDIARALTSDEFEASVVCLRERKKIDGPDLPESLRKAGIKVSYLRVTGFWQMIFSLRAQLQEERPDVIHCHLPLSVIIGTIAGRLAGVRSIIAHHHNSKVFNSPRINFLLSLLSPFITLNICYSETVEQELFGTMNVIYSPIVQKLKRSVTIYNFIDTDAIERASKRVGRENMRDALGFSVDNILILSAARLVDWKGHDVLIRAFAVVSHTIPSARLVIAGDGPMRAELQKLAQDLNAEKSVIFLGSRSDVYQLMAASDVFALPYHYKEGKNVPEAIGVAILEAMALELPVVISEYPSAYKFVRPGESGMMVKPADVDALVLVLVRLCTERLLRERLGIAAKAFVYDYLSLQRMIPIYESVYRSLVT